MEFVSATGASEGKSEPGKVTFAILPTLEPGATAEWTVVVKAIAPGDVRFRATLTSADTERPVEKTESTRFYR